MVKKRDGKRVDTGKKKENGAPIYNWIKNDDTTTMDNNDVKKIIVVYLWKLLKWR